MGVQGEVWSHGSVLPVERDGTGALRHSNNGRMLTDGHAALISRHPY